VGDAWGGIYRCLYSTERGGLVLLADRACVDPEILRRRLGQLAR
jgi:hypothetical protein